MASNINPSLTPVNSLDNFRFWCQKVLPLVYDDSLSYYEVLGKMVVQLNDVIDNVNADTENVLTLKDAFLELQTYVNNFFDDIDQLASYAERAEDAQTAANASAINAASSASNASASSLAAMNARDAAVTAKEAAEASASTASTAATNANTKASEAAQSAITAQTAQASASQSATLAASDRSAAQTAASTATAKANEASTSASNASQSAEDAEAAAISIEDSAQQITTNTNDISNLRESINTNLMPDIVDGFLHFTKTDMENGSFTSTGYSDANDRCRVANHWIKARKGDIVVGHRKTADIVMAITDDPNGITTLYTSGWRTSDFALATPYDGYYVLLGKTALENFDGDFTIYPAKQFFKALPERYYLDEITTTLSSITDKQTEPCLCFPLITDIHYGAIDDSSHPYLFHKTYRNILKVIQEKRSDAIVCLGDVTEGDFSAKQTAIDFGTRVNDMFMMLGVPYLLTIGNHDDNRYSKESTSKFTNGDIFRTNTAYIDNNVIYNSATNGRDYYIDFDNLKIRLISINAVGNQGYEYVTNTVTWFTNTALNTPDNYLAVILTHVSPISSQNYNNTAVTNGAAIAQAIEDYISGSKDAFQLYGHSHCDVAFTSPYLSIATCCSQYTNNNGNPALWPEGATMPTREEYTKTEDCWDYVIIRPQSKKVNLIRFGAGDDREFTY